MTWRISIFYLIIPLNNHGYLHSAKHCWTNKETFYVPVSASRHCVFGCPFGRPFVVHPRICQQFGVTWYLCAYVVEWFQWNLGQRFIMWVGTAERVFEVSEVKGQSLPRTPVTSQRQSRWLSISSTTESVIPRNTDCMRLCRGQTYKDQAWGECMHSVMLHCPFRTFTLEFLKSTDYIATSKLLHVGLLLSGTEWPVMCWCAVNNLLTPLLLLLLLLLLHKSERCHGAVRS